MRIRKLSALFMGLFLVLPLAVPASDNLGKVRFHEYPGSIIHLATWAMVENNICEKHGIECERVLLANGPLAQQAAAAGSVDIIMSSADVMMQAVSRGHDLQMLGTEVSNNVYSFTARSGLDVPESSYPENVRALGELSRLRVGVTARGSATEMYARALLEGAGVNPDSATYVAVGAPNTAYSALLSQQVDVVLSWDPIPALCQVTDNCRVLVDMRRGEGPEMLRAMNGGFVVWQARTRYIEQNKEKIDAFLRANAEAKAWVADEDNFDEVMALARRNFEPGQVGDVDKFMDLVVRESIEQLGSTFDRSVVDGFNNFLTTYGLIDEPLDVNAIVYDDAP
ncbi:MAG: ABC transporter substrate-binding protein [Ectothiorhodospiraceae bacterium]|nr:ABC transporter substrate-binding protein [Ectothiorhodospiraceae bacterium]